MLFILFLSIIIVISTVAFVLNISSQHPDASVPASEPFDLNLSNIIENRTHHGWIN